MPVIGSKPRNEKAFVGLGSDERISKYPFFNPMSLSATEI
jgi:hypothetical protein